MKNILLTTSALVAFAGAAVAEVSFSGNVEIGYNDVEYNGFYVDGGVTLTGSMDFGGGVAVSVSYGLNIYDDINYLQVDDFPTVTVTTPWATLTAGSVESAGVDHFSSVDGMSGVADFFEENGEFIVRVDAEFGGVMASVSAWAPNYQFGGPLDLISVGASGELGGFSFGFGYDNFNNNTFGVNVGTSFGGFDVAVAYMADDNSNNSIGISVGATFGDIGVVGYYAINNNDWDAYGVSVDWSNGPISVGGYWDGDENGASNFGVEVGYLVMDNVTVAAGWDEGGGFFAGAHMELEGGAWVEASWSEYGDAGQFEFLEGITVRAGFSF